MGDTPRSQERLLDAEEIEKVAATLTRPTARMHLEALAKKLRKEGEALQRVEKSNAMAEPSATNNDAMEVEEKKEEDSVPTLSASSTSSMPKAAPISIPTPIDQRAAPPLTSGIKFIPISTFSFDAGGYNAPFVTVYAPLTGVGSCDRSNITCNFEKTSFDLIVKDLNGKSYRLFQDNLEKDIEPSKCKYIVKSDKIIIKLAKVKQGEYGGYDYWTKLTDKKAREKSSKIKENPSSSIMDLMKQMYDEGDDNMKKIIGETMMKQQRGEIGKDDPMKGLDKMDI